MDSSRLIDLLRNALPGLIAVYLFGSRARGEDDASSDLDLAVLVEGKVDPLGLWDLGGKVSDAALCPVDLLDLRQASTVMQYQVLTRGERIWSGDPTAAGLYECFILAEKCALDEARAGVLEEIRRDGRIHG